MSGYTKLYSSIIHSTIWREDDKTRIVWITMLAMADMEGNVMASLPGLADASRVTIPECEMALEKLSSPDLHSRSKEKDGRRIEDVDGGWNIINRNKYRDMQADRTEYFREYRRKERSKNGLAKKSLFREDEPKEQATSRTKPPQAKTEPEIGTAEFIAYWNQHGSLPNIQNMNPSRVRQLKTRKKEKVFFDNWKSIINKLSESTFHTGNNDRGWKATVDWILKNDTNYMKILEMPDRKSSVDIALGRTGKTLAEAEQLEKELGL
jgi:hypothetical protein